MESPYKGSVMREAFPCHDVIVVPRGPRRINSLNHEYISLQFHCPGVMVGFHISGVNFIITFIFANILWVCLGRECVVVLFNFCSKMPKIRKIQITAGTMSWFVHRNLLSKGVMRWYIFSCDQAALRRVIFVRPSVRLPVPPFWQRSCHLIILKFSGVIIIDRRDDDAKGLGQRSKVKATEVMTPFSRFRALTPDLIHIWRWNDAQSMMLLIRAALFIFRVIRQISRSHC